MSAERDSCRRVWLADISDICWEKRETVEGVIEDCEGGPGVGVEAAAAAGVGAGAGIKLIWCDSFEICDENCCCMVCISFACESETSFLKSDKICSTCLRVKSAEEAADS